MSDVDDWMRFGTEILGLMPSARSGKVRLRMDDRTWRIAVLPSPADDIVFAGFEVEDANELAAQRARLTVAGLDMVDLTPEEISDREVDAGFHLRDPDGLRIEFVTGHARTDEPFRSGDVSGFVTGDQGLGHIVLSVSDLEGGIAFYEEIGFALSDFITAPVGPHILRIAFLHCNPRHHSVAIAQMPATRRLHHFMVEVDEIDEVLLAQRRSIAQGYKTGSMGRHPNDMMLSFYIRTPAGFDVEYGWGGKTIGDGDPVIEYDRTSIWGHEPAIQ